MGMDSANTVVNAACFMGFLSTTQAKEENDTVLSTHTHARTQTTNPAAQTAERWKGGALAHLGLD